MKKYISILITIVLTLTTSTYINAEVINYKAYYDVLAFVCGGTPKLYEGGKISDEENQRWNDEWNLKGNVDAEIFSYRNGIYHMTLIDMDNDGIKELVFSYGRYYIDSEYATLYIYTLEDGKPLKIYENEKIGYDGMMNGHGGNWNLGVSNVGSQNYIIITENYNEGAMIDEYTILAKRGNAIKLEKKLRSAALDLLGNYDKYTVMSDSEKRVVSEEEYNKIALKYMVYNGTKQLGVFQGNINKIFTYRPQTYIIKTNSLGILMQ